MPNSICPAGLDCFEMTNCQPNQGIKSCENYWTCKSWTWAWSIPYTYDLEKKILTVLEYGYQYSNEINIISDIEFKRLIRDTWKENGWHSAVVNPYYPIEETINPIPF